MSTAYRPSDRTVASGVVGVVVVVVVVRLKILALLAFRCSAPSVRVHT